MFMDDKKYISETGIEEEGETTLFINIGSLHMAHGTSVLGKQSFENEKSYSEF